MYSGVLWTSHFIQGTRKTRPCLTGHPLGAHSVSGGPGRAAVPRDAAGPRPQPNPRLPHVQHRGQDRLHGGLYEGMVQVQFFLSNSVMPKC